jgi:hypothetical protein
LDDADGGGSEYKPRGGGVSFRGFLLLGLVVAAWVGLFLPGENLLGREMLRYIYRLALCFLGIAASVRMILHPDKVVMPRPETARIVGIVLLMLFTAFAAVSVADWLER